MDNWVISDEEGDKHSTWYFGQKKAEVQPVDLKISRNIGLARSFSSEVPFVLKSPL